MSISFGRINTNAIYTIISAVCAIVAIGISMRSCSHAENSNKIAEQALRESKSAIFNANRPYVTLSVAKLEPVDRYCNAQKEGDTLFLEVAFMMHNAGKTPATNIRYTVKISSSGSIPRPMVGGKDMVLAPDETFYAVLKVGYSPPPPTDSEIKRINSGGETYTISCLIKYSTALDSSKTLETSIRCEVNADMVNYLARTMK